jgi:CoA:oxalate CoA-transferase
MTAQELPLNGLRVIDLTTFLSGPFATQTLADLGAEIIKIEARDGDASRHIPPYFVGDDSAYFLANNRNKKSVNINLKSAEGVHLLEQLIMKADVVVDNFRPGVTERLGLNVEEICARNSRLIWASISGFGQTGPWRDRPAYDMIVQALSGVMSLTGEPGRPAVRLGIPVGDLVAGMYAVIGILGALSSVRNSGRGRIIDVAMLDSQLAMLSYQAVYALVSGTTPKPQGAGHDSLVTYRSFRGGDNREFVVTANTERMWVGLCAALDLEELIDDPRYANAALRLEHREPLWQILEARFAEENAEFWVDKLVEHHVPSALIKTVTEALLDARRSDRGMVVHLEDTERGAFDAIGSPIKFIDTEPHPLRYPPRNGQDTQAVLSELLELTPLQFDRLRKAGVIYGGEPELLS